MEDEGSAALVEIEAGGAIHNESAELVTPSDPDTGSQMLESSVVNENSTLSVTEDLEGSEPDPDSRSRDRNGHFHGCASLESSLDQLRHHFQSEIDSLKETVLNCTANLNFPLSHVATSADSTKLFKENHELQQRLREVELKYENLKTEAKMISNENKSLVTALRLLNNKFSLHHQGRNLHLIPDEGVGVNNSQVNYNTSSAPKQNKEQAVKQQSSKSKQSKRKRENKDLGKEPSTSGNNKSAPKDRSIKATRSTFIAGDSILKHLNGRSLSAPHSKVQFSSFPGCTTSDMADHTRPLVRRRSDPIIIHVGTNSLRNATSTRECADEIVDPARLVEQEDITVAILSLTARADDTDIGNKAKEMNKILKKFCR